MKKTEIRVVCDICSDLRASAEIRCDKHGVDLCNAHMRAHFDPQACRLIPVEREQTDMEKHLERLERRANASPPKRDRPATD